MLNITRHGEQTVVLGSPHAPLGIIRVKTIMHNRVVLAFENFPQDFPIHRSEIAEEIIQDSLRERRSKDREVSSEE
jgi:sRNA-binding carbon storage regulator CsrA